MTLAKARIKIVQAPMIGCGVALSAAVCEAGGIGMIACASLSPVQVVTAAQEIRARTIAPFGLNFFCHQPPASNEIVDARWREMLAPYYAEAGIDAPDGPIGPQRAPFDGAMCAALEEVRPPIVSFHFGMPSGELLARVKATGAEVWSSATSVAEARWLQAHGADVIIAQGAEAGGHRGMFLSDDIYAQSGLFALLPQVVDAVRVPVVAAGGIGDMRGIAAAFALGACAVQMGTAFLLTPEAGRSALHKAAIASAHDDSTQMTNVYTGRPARGIVTRFMREMGPMNAAAPAFPLAAAAIDPVRAIFEKQGDNDFSLLWAGQAAALAREEPASDLVRRLWQEAQDLGAKIRIT